MTYNCLYVIKPKQTKQYFLTGFQSEAFTKFNLAVFHIKAFFWWQHEIYCLSQDIRYHKTLSNPTESIYHKQFFLQATSI